MSSKAPGLRYRALFLILFCFLLSSPGSDAAGAASSNTPAKIKTAAAPSQSSARPKTKVGYFHTADSPVLCQVTGILSMLTSSSCNAHMLFDNVLIAASLFSHSKASHCIQALSGAKSAKVESAGEDIPAWQQYVASHVRAIVMIREPVKVLALSCPLHVPCLQLTQLESCHPKKCIRSVPLQPGVNFSAAAWAAGARKVSMPPSLLQNAIHAVYMEVD